MAGYTARASAERGVAAPTRAASKSRPPCSPLAAACRRRCPVATQLVSVDPRTGTFSAPPPAARRSLLSLLADFYAESVADWRGLPHPLVCIGLSTCSPFVG